MNIEPLLYLSRQDIESLKLPMSNIIDALDVMFKEKGEGRVEMPPKPGIHPLPDAFIHAMPAYLPAFEAAGLKWVSGFPENPKSGLPYISGLIILNDPHTGIPIAVMDCTWITAKRTGAATAIAAKYLARENSSVVGMVACGVQGRSNLEALNEVFNIKKVKAFDINKKVAGDYAQKMGAKLGLEIVLVNSVEEAVRESDIVVTSGPILKNPNPLIESEWFEKGGFACPIDFDSYWKGEAFDSVEWIATDDIPQFHYYKKIGYFQNTPDPVSDLGEIVVGKKPGRTHEDERIICLNLGLALEDMAVAKLLYEEAQLKGIGEKLPL